MPFGLCPGVCLAGASWIVAAVVMVAPMPRFLSRGQVSED
jgi:hypothetical protein